MLNSLDKYIRVKDPVCNRFITAVSAPGTLQSIHGLRSPGFWRLARGSLRQRHTATASAIPSKHEEVQSAYVHLPFCKRRCYYCDFPITVAGKHATGEATPAMLDYVELLKQEILQQAPSSAPLSTVFFGTHKGCRPALSSPGTCDLTMHTWLHAPAQVTCDLACCAQQASAILPCRRYTF